MAYLLVWCPNLGVFAFEAPFSGLRILLTESEMRTKVSGNATLNEWVDYANNNPNVECIYDMLPK